MMKLCKKLIRIINVCLIIGLFKSGFCFANEVRAIQLARLSIEELINMKVTSVLKTPQSWSSTPAAVYLLTQEDIRRSGAANIPDLLRLVPGVQVAELDENIYAVSIRGFNDIHSNKLLVMLDGRSIYNHIFSGVIWSNLNVFMEDIERIEIIRGPGSSAWGANAVNGVINIISKKSENTKGTLIQLRGGKPEQVSAGVRYGGEIGNNAAFRIYAKGFDSSNDYISQPGFESGTQIKSGMGGFRTDWNIKESDIINLQGEFTRYDSKTDEKNANRSNTSTTIDERIWHILSKWTHIYSLQSKTMFQIYYQNEERENDYDFSTIDLDFQHEFEWSASHHLVWGLGYRVISDEMIYGLYGNYTFDPIERIQHLYSLFIQDTIQVIPDYIDLTLGSKFEHNDNTGYEIQPGIRLIFTPHENHNFWAAFSRAVRTPSRLDTDSTSNQVFPQPNEPGQEHSKSIQIMGDKNFNSEDLLAYEIGYRANLLKEFWFDLALFYNVYDNLSTYKKKEKNIWVISNDMEGETYGIEISLDYRPVKWWRLSGAWSFMEMDINLKDKQAADLTGYIENTSPKHQISVHSALDIGKQVKFDLWLRHVDDIRHLRPPTEVNPFFNKLDSYIGFDARLAWKPEKNVELSLTGRNLGGSHQEFTNYEVEESVFFNVKIEFGK